MEIRRLEERDLPALAVMVVALAAHHRDVATVSEAALRRDCLGAAPWLPCWVAEGRAGLVGYAACQTRVQMQFGRRGVDLHHLFVEAHMRGQGIGRALVAAVGDWARAQGCDWMVVGTEQENDAAQAFYRGLGFRSIEIEARRFWLPIAALDNPGASG